VVLLGAQAAAVGALATEGRWAAVVLAVAAGRVAVVGACARGVPAASPTGFGALVAGTQPSSRAAAWALLAVLASVAAVPGRWWQGPLAVVLAGLLLAPTLRHVVRRLGGVTGDVLGAGCEVAVTVVAVVCSLA
jgi:adenosylcobinamide-GDP ribazoletransferase